MVGYRLISVIVIVSTASTLSQLEFPYQKSKINHATHAKAFDKLLDSIVKVNQQRLDTIKKFNRLQELKPYAELRADPTRDSDESSSSEEREVIYLVIPDKQKTSEPQDSHPIAEPIKTPPAPPAERNVTNTTKHEDPKPDIILEPIRNHNISDSYIAPRGTNDTMAHMSLSKNGLEYLRQSIARSCKSRDVKKCKRACKDAVNSACSYYECRRKLKKSLKKHCKKSCKDEFRRDW